MTACDVHVFVCLHAGNVGGGVDELAWDTSTQLILGRQLRAYRRGALDETRCQLTYNGAHAAL